MKHFHIIGVDDNPEQHFSEEILSLIQSGTIFSGGLRQYEIVSKLLPADAEWVNITVPLDKVFETYDTYGEHEDIIVFASGDPLFFGFAATVQKRMPEVRMEVFPAFNSLQMLAHRMTLPYEEMHAVSVTGRSWHELDRALIENHRLIGILTDHQHTPDAIAARMQEYHFNQYRMIVGSHLGNPKKEEIQLMFDYTSAIGMNFNTPNCVILQRQKLHNLHTPAPGIPDKQFVLLDGREKMITKAPIRLLTLSALRLNQSEHFWDVGFCTGSISIEARRQYPHLHIHAFEIREACKEIIEQNSHNLSAPGIETHIGDFLAADVSKLPAPDAVFIGGHGGKLNEFVQKIGQYIKPGGTLVFNSVSSESLQEFLAAALEHKFSIDDINTIRVNDNNPINIISVIKNKDE